MMIVYSGLRPLLLLLAMFPWQQRPSIERARLVSRARGFALTPAAGSRAAEGQSPSSRVLLPRNFLNFEYPPTPGRSIRVGSGDNLQRALNSAQRGDEIVLAAGATFTGNYTLPDKRGSAADGWIVIRSERLSALPAIGTRVSAAQASLMPRIMTPNTDPALRTAAAASGWWLAGLEVTVSPSLTAQQYGLVWLGEGGAPQTTLASVPTDLVLDRMYIHGQTKTNMSRCIALNSARTQITDSYIVECHGQGFDSQAIWGGNGPGPYKIVNNTLSGAGENIMFGGSDPTIPGLVPSDIEIRRNYLYTPIAWKGVWTKKNLLETKNASRVLIEANVFDGSWLDAQTGWAIILKSENQYGGCKWCRTTDVTIRHNLIRNVGAGINIVGIGSEHHVDTPVSRILIQETVFDNVGEAPYGGEKRGIQLLGSTSDITVERTVISGPIIVALMLDNIRPAMRTVFRDNVWAYGQYGAIASDAGPGTASLKVGAPGAVWDRMIFVGSGATGFPVGTGFASRERHALTAGRVRAAVDSATSGVVR